jgi:hypothetical protein
MGLANPWRSKQQDVAAFLDKAQGRQLAEGLAVDRGLVVELEVGQVLPSG